MKKAYRIYEEKILEELESIPETELAKIYELIRYLKLGILASKNENLDHKFNQDHLSSKSPKTEKSMDQGDDEYPKAPYFSLKEMAE